MDLEQFKDVLRRSREEVGKVIIGNEAVIDYALITIIAGGHALIEGVPGVAKTLLVRTLARVLGCDTNRIQFTPDLMPSDITGTNIYNLKDQEFNLVPGPIFTTFLLADEINRAPAKTQSALLQAMQEREVTIDRKTYTLGANFTVFATENPIEYEGTYPLPEAQKDRFMFKLQMECPDRDSEYNLATQIVAGRSPESILESGEVAAVVSMEELAGLGAMLNQVTLKPELIAYVVDLVRRTREHPSILVGAGPRATNAMLMASRARAALSDRDFVTPDDIRDVSQPILGHRLILRPEYEIEGLSIEETVTNILSEVAVPR